MTPPADPPRAFGAARPPEYMTHLCAACCALATVERKLDLVVCPACGALNLVVPAARVTAATG